MGARLVAFLQGQDLARLDDSMEELTTPLGSISIRIRDTDSQLLQQMADSDDRTPAEQAASFVHKALMTERAKANAGDKPAIVRRGPRSAAA